ncbi:MAG: hypothetical protein K2X10_07140 [Hyphomicrobiales bacterium]|nr:hypothetical protein [Hyphomicrobiales bacterium]OQW84794.1 MAG: hypothetical protein BVN31_01605 [Proteobacteria bacterium ST_bin15]
MVKEGADLSGDWENIRRAISDIGDSNIPYQPLGNNSNATVDEALRRSGLPGGTYTDPGTGRYAPGSGTLDPNYAPPPLRPSIDPDDPTRGIGDGTIGNPLGDFDPSGWPPSAPLAPRDPLVLDLNGNGLDLISAAASTASFDFDNDGFRERTGWVGPGDGFLVRDINGNGAVDGIGELFGNTLIDGYTALRALDSNGDNRITASDTNFAQLRVWRDLNGDGVSQAGELVSLASLGITALGLERNVSNTLNAGNSVDFTGTFTRADGTTGSTAAISFATNRTLTAWVPPAGFVVSADTQHLPQLKGYGQLRDLNAAATLDATLLGAVRAFALSRTMKARAA